MIPVPFLFSQVIQFFVDKSVTCVYHLTITNENAVTPASTEICNYCNLLFLAAVKKVTTAMYWDFIHSLFTVPIDFGQSFSLLSWSLFFFLNTNWPN